MISRRCCIARWSLQRPRTGLRMRCRTRVFHLEDLGTVISLIFVIFNITADSFYVVSYENKSATGALVCFDNAYTHCVVKAHSP